ncbi:hypothetical protein RRG08_051680 [Elysia crispata]|uniref:Uncharacterized protein n=1 Tax=Elysia crispata TaxID=231223 RepID=A0AAE1AFF7_9GAST|nr:hypothetical protein RRG08_051680 [Elysia crispata]
MFGGLTIGLAYMVDRLGETAFLISINLFGMVGGPVVGVIINGIFLPFVNSWGAGAGLVTSLTVGLYIGTEPLLNPPPSFNLPMRTDGCWRDNVTSQMSDVGNTSAPLPALGLPGNLTAGHKYLEVLKASYTAQLAQATLTVLVSVGVGGLVSLLTGRNRNRILDPRTYIRYTSDPSSLEYQETGISRVLPPVMCVSRTEYSTCYIDGINHKSSLIINLRAFNSI